MAGRSPIANNSSRFRISRMTEAPHAGRGFTAAYFRRRIGIARMSVIRATCSATVGDLHGPTIAASFTTDRKSTRLNSSHSQISYAVFCLKKKKSASPKTPPNQLKLNYSNYNDVGGVVSASNGLVLNRIVWRLGIFLVSSVLSLRHTNSE